MKGKQDSGSQEGLAAFPRNGAIHKGRGSGKSAANLIVEASGVLMRGIIVLIVLFVILVGGAILLSRSVTEQPIKTIEVDVTPDAKPE